MEEKALFLKTENRTGSSKVRRKTIAIKNTTEVLATSANTVAWEYFISGAEREVKLTPFASQSPGDNTTLTTLNEILVGKDQATFYLYDHLGNTRVTYTPTGFTTSIATQINSYTFTGSLDGWQGFSASVAVVNNALEVTTDIGAASPATTTLISPPFVASTTYTVSLDVDFGTTPNGVGLSVVGVGAFPLINGTNTVTFTTPANFSGFSLMAVYLVSGGSTTSAYTYTVDNVSVTGNFATKYTVNNIEFVGDYFPYGKVLREFVNGEKERYLTTQHERDNETGLDYRGARYYDSDVARFLSLDPLASDYPNLSDYNYVAGNPIMFIDPDGKRIKYRGSFGYRVATIARVMAIRLLAPKKIRKKIRALARDKNVELKFSNKIQAKDDVGSYTAASLDNTRGNINYNVKSLKRATVAGAVKGTRVRLTVLPAIVNEIHHAYDDLISKGTQDVTTVQNDAGEFIEQDEIESNKSENSMRKRLNQPQRQEDTHRGTLHDNSKSAKEEVKKSKERVKAIEEYKKNN